MSKSIIRIAAVALLLCTAHAAQITAPEELDFEKDTSGIDDTEYISLFAGMPTPPAECAALEKAPTCEQMQLCLGVLPAFCKTVPAQFTEPCDEGLKQLQTAVGHVCKTADGAVVNDSTAYVGDLSFFDAHRSFFGEVVAPECLQLSNKPSCAEMQTCITAMPACGDEDSDAVWQCNEGIRHLMNAASAVCHPADAESYDDEPMYPAGGEQEGGMVNHDPLSEMTEEQMLANAEDPEFVAAIEAQEEAQREEYAKELEAVEQGEEEVVEGGVGREGGVEHDGNEQDVDLSNYTEDPETGVFYPPEQVEYEDTDGNIRRGDQDVPYGGEQEGGGVDHSSN